MTNWEDTVMGNEEIVQLIKGTGWGFKRAESLNLVSNYKAVAQAQAKLSFPAGEKQGYERGIRKEQARMTKALRELLKQGWTLSDVIEAEDTMGID